MEYQQSDGFTFTMAGVSTCSCSVSKTEPLAALLFTSKLLKRKRNLRAILWREQETICSYDHQCDAASHLFISFLNRLPSYVTYNRVYHNRVNATAFVNYKRFICTVKETLLATPWIYSWFHSCYLYDQTHMPSICVGEVVSLL